MRTNNSLYSGHSMKFVFNLIAIISSLLLMTGLSSCEENESADYTFKVNFGDIKVSNFAGGNIDEAMATQIEGYCVNINLEGDAGGFTSCEADFSYETRLEIARTGSINVPEISGEAFNLQAGKITGVEVILKIVTSERNSGVYIHYARTLTEQYEINQLDTQNNHVEATLVSADFVVSPDLVPYPELGLIQALDFSTLDSYNNYPYSVSVENIQIISDDGSPISKELSTQIEGLCFSLQFADGSGSLSCGHESSNLFSYSQRVGFSQSQSLSATITDAELNAGSGADIIDLQPVLKISGSFYKPGSQKIKYLDLPTVGYSNVMPNNSLTTAVFSDLVFEIDSELQVYPRD